MLSSLNDVSGGAAGGFLMKMFQKRLNVFVANL